MDNRIEKAELGLLGFLVQTLVHSPNHVKQVKDTMPITGEISPALWKAAELVEQVNKQIPATLDKFTRMKKLRAEGRRLMALGDVISKCAGEAIEWALNNRR